MTDHRAEAERFLAASDTAYAVALEGSLPLEEQQHGAALFLALATRAQAHATLALGDALSPQDPEEPTAEPVDEETASPGHEAKAMALSATPEAWARLGEALRERREAMGLSRRALSEKANVSEKSIQVAEEGRVPSSRWPQSIGRIAAVLGWEPRAAIRLVLTEQPTEEAVS